MVPRGEHSLCPPARRSTSSPIGHRPLRDLSSTTLNFAWYKLNNNIINNISNMPIYVAILSRTKFILNAVSCPGLDHVTGFLLCRSRTLNFAYNNNNNADTSFRAQFILNAELYTR